MKTKLAYTLTPNEVNDSVQITYDTGKRSWYGDDYGKPIHEYLTVSFDAAGGDERWAKFNYQLQRNATDTLANWQNRESACRYITEDAVTAAEIMVKKLIAKREKLQRAGRKTWQYKLIAAKCKELGWPSHYASDLDHDAYRLATVNPDVFLWSVMEAGTWLFTDDTSLQWRDGVVKYGGKDKYYLVTSSGMREIIGAQFASYRFVE
jgi:hypothetical protein